MSVSHRPTWAAQKASADSAHLSAQTVKGYIPAHTRLKFRQPGQAADIRSIQTNPERRRDLKRELEAAEREARNKKRIAQGLPPLEDDVKQDGEKEEGEEEEESAKRRRLIREARELDRDDDDEDEEEAKGEEGKGKANKEDADDAPSQAAAEQEEERDSEDDDSDDSEDDDSDEEDDTAALLRELEKIKRERAEEKARMERQRQEAELSQRQDEIALGNPLLNLENAMRNGAAGSASPHGSAAGLGMEVGGKKGFGVKRRWDDDVIFKNQASGAVANREAGGFVNDLTRSEFHKKFMNRYIK
ncbi:complexed with cef1p [Thecaphora frezii]